MLHVPSLPIRRVPWPPAGTSDPDSLVTHEWLATNGLGGYASGTVAGVMTRRYHGLLIAALDAPLGRTVMLSHVAEQLRFPDGRRIEVGGRERTGDAPDAHGTGYLVEFRLEGGLPVWRAGGPFPSLRLRLWAEDPSFTLKPKRIDNVLYPVEESRGYQARGDLWSPGYFRFVLQPGRRAALVASTESSATMNVLQPDQ